MSHEMELHPTRDAVRCKHCGITIGGESLRANGATKDNCVEVADLLAHPFYCEVRDVQIKPARSVVTCTCGKENDLGAFTCWRCGGQLR